MRPIKFRAWDTELKRYVYFTLSDLMGGGIGYGDGSKFVVQQFTGLHDKNGKEIYEGDIVRSGNGRLWEVKFGEYVATAFTITEANGWYIEGDGACLPYFAANAKSDDVIGNIYENPELLTA